MGKGNLLLLHCDIYCIQSFVTSPFCPGFDQIPGLVHSRPILDQCSSPPAQRTAASSAENVGAQCAATGARHVQKRMLKPAPQPRQCTAAPLEDLLSHHPMHPGLFLVLLGAWLGTSLQFLALDLTRYTPLYS